MGGNLVMSIEDSPSPRTGKHGFPDHPRLGLLGCVIYWARGGMSHAVTMIVALTVKLGITERVRNAQRHRQHVMPRRTQRLLITWKVDLQRQSNTRMKSNVFSLWLRSVMRCQYGHSRVILTAGTNAFAIGSKSAEVKERQTKATDRSPLTRPLLFVLNSTRMLSCKRNYCRWVYVFEIQIHNVHIYIYIYIAK